MPADTYIRVPKPAWPQLMILLATETATLKKAIKFLAASPPRNDVEDLAEACQSKTGVSTEIAEALIATAMNVCNLQRQLELTASEVFQHIAADLNREQFPNWREQYAAEWPRRTVLLDSLVAADSPIDIMSKARELLFEFQCLLEDSAVLTDVRHIYNSDATAIVGGLVLHTLALNYREGSDHRQSHITMSESDIDNLIKQFTRAKTKSSLALKALADSHIDELSPKRNS